MRPGSVNLVVLSFPYFDQRDYEDGGIAYDGQIGREDTADDYLRSLWSCVRALWDLLTDDGVLIVNMGDKRSGSSAPGTTSGLGKLGYSPDSRVQGARSRKIGGYKKGAGFGRPKSKMLLPHRFAIGCMDGLADPCVLDHDHDAEALDCRGIGWITRQDIVWEKTNGMPESATDRTRDNTEYWFHLTKNETYYSATVEIREPPSDYSRPTSNHRPVPGQTQRQHIKGVNSLGRIPGSVWRVPTGGPAVPDYLVEDETGIKLLDAEPLWRYAHHRYRNGNHEPVEVRPIDHYAAFPTEWPRRLVLAFSPPAVCTVCGEGHRPVVERTTVFDKARDQAHASDIARRAVERGVVSGGTAKSTLNGQTTNRLLGYACSCCPTVDGHPDIATWVPPPTRPAVVLDSFGGTGTTAMVADALGRFGISMDMSRDYSLIARWRIFESGDQAKVRASTEGERQVSLFD